MRADRRSAAATAPNQTSFSREKRKMKALEAYKRAACDRGCGRAGTGKQRPRRPSSTAGPPPWPFPARGDVLLLVKHGAPAEYKVRQKPRPAAGGACDVWWGPSQCLILHVPHQPEACVGAVQRCLAHCQQEHPRSCQHAGRHRGRFPGNTCALGAHPALPYHTLPYPYPRPASCRKPKMGWSRRRCKALPLFAEELGDTLGRGADPESGHALLLAAAAFRPGPAALAADGDWCYKAGAPAGAPPNPTPTVARTALPASCGDTCQVHPWWPHRALEACCWQSWVGACRRLAGRLARR
jgi:hypothetical protein